MEKIIATKHWRYFPHVSTDNMGAGFYDDLEALQGEFHTYYCGEVMSFPLVELVAEYSRALIDEYF